MRQRSALSVAVSFAPIILLAGTALVCSGGPAFSAPAPCEIEVVDKSSGWPVPLVELRTVNGVSFVTDNAGRVAFDLPEFMGHEVWLDLRGQGYEVKKDGFGNEGIRLKMEPGAHHRVEVGRTIIAQRLGRLTGAGLFSESQKLGKDGDWQESGIVGCDTVQNAAYHGRLFWAWGDTSVARYPLGIFDGTGALTDLRPLDHLEPPLRLRFDYFCDAQAAPRAIAKMPGAGPTWLGGCVSLPDAAGREHLVAVYGKVRNGLDIYQWGAAEWNDSKAAFDFLKVLWDEPNPASGHPLMLDGHAALWTDQAGKKWALFCNPFPTARCPATYEAWLNTNTWERLAPSKTLKPAGQVGNIKAHTGAIAWNPWRQRWVAIFVQGGGSSPLGEVWYAEAKEPTGPWGRAVKILSHDNYSFYNPAIHSEFTAADSPMLIFEGTYTAEFANHPPITPKYNYNQVLYRLDLSDPRLRPAHAGD